MARKLRRIGEIGLLVLGILMVLQPAAMADVKLTLEGTPTSGDLGGVYTSPYPIQVSSGSQNYVTQLLSISCDDFTSEIYSGESWYANIYSLIDVTDSSTHDQKFPENSDATESPAPGPISVDFPGDSTESPAESSFVASKASPIAYEAAGWLAYEILYANLGTAAMEEYSYAIWQIFYSKAYQGWGGNGLSAGQVGAVDTAMDSAFAVATTGTAAQFAALTKSSNAPYGYALDIYTPCGIATPCVTPGDHAVAQEFLGMTKLQADLVPEGSAVAFLAFDLVALFGVIFLVRKRFLAN